VSTAVLFPDFIVIGFRPGLLRRPHSYKTNSEISHNAINIGSSCDFQVSQGSVETYSWW